MKIKSWGAFLLLSLFFMQTPEIQAQKIRRFYEINWKENIIYAPNEDFRLELLYFEGAVTDEDYPELPLFLDLISIDRFYTDYDISVQNIKTVPLDAKDISLLPADFSQNELQINIRTVTAQKRNFARVTFLPILKTSGNQYRKVTSVEIAVTGKSSPQPKTIKSYKENSILSQGNWYKIAVTKSGIHQVTYKDLQALGVPLSNLRSANIAVFGNGGGTLPEANSVPRPDDLIENPIIVFDGNDGVFGTNDYFIFYANSPHTWKYSETTRRFSHSTNIYSDSAYYFINVDPGIGEKKRIQVIDNGSLVTNLEANSYIHYEFIEEDKINLAESGRHWFGDLFDGTTTRKYQFTLPAFLNSTAYLTCSAGFASTAISNLAVSVNGNKIGSLSDNGRSGLIANIVTDFFPFTPNSSNVEVTLTYEKTANSSKLYLDFLELQGYCRLEMHSGQFPFFNPDTKGSGNVTLFNVKKANENTMVWDISNSTVPFQVKGTLQNGTFSFKAPTDSLRYYIAFDGSSYEDVFPVGKVKNQNLHRGSNVDMIIVSHPLFSSQAERLAKYRREQDGLSVRIVTPQEIYNEFSSGAQDPTAIRDYMKMIYDKSNGNYPKYLLLFGRPSYDYRGRKNSSKLFVPNYQSNTIINNIALRANDDYFALLDSTEGENSVGYLDIAVGRFPVSSLEQAKIAVDKTINYSSKHNLVSSNSTQVSNLSDWRNIVTFIADDEDSNEHIDNAEESAALVSKNKTVNLEKIYCDAFRQESHSGGKRYPDVNKAINNRIQRGSFMTTYVGHGGGTGWAEERILTLSEINQWNNLYNQTILTTLTCEFAWYDREAISPGELAFLNPKGGASGLISTSRVAFMGSNRSYAVGLFSGLYQKETNQHRYKTLGELNVAAKNHAGGAVGNTNMIFVIGDPAMPLAIPKYNVITDSINGQHISSFNDTISAFDKVTIKGRVTYEDSTTITSFNGNIFPSVFDKPITMHTLEQDEKSLYREFEVQKNILFKGNASVKDGYFEFSFIVPKDINYNYGNGKISYYAREQSSDAAGYFDDFIIGGSSTQQYMDSIGPDIELYMNDESFVDGGMTNQNPILLVHLRDDLGINTTGNGIGHDIVAILDDAAESAIILNDYYETKLDSFNCGSIRYPLKDISSGKHVIEVRAWDIANNMSKKRLHFEVVSDEKFSLKHVLNYPNPFTTHTDFFFEHNQAGDVFDIMIHIFTISGKLVKSISTQQYLQGNRCEAIPWDGRDDFGDKLAKGVYLYRMRVRNQQGEIAEKIEKLVIL